MIGMSGLEIADDSYRPVMKKKPARDRQQPDEISMRQNKPRVES